MYLNADELPDGLLLQGFDLCIVGAGAAGLVMAHRLIDSTLKVLMLSGGTTADRSRPAPDRQSVYRGTVGPFLKKVAPVFPERSRFPMHGGTTNHFGFWSRPLNADDLTPRQGYRAASWPIT